MEGEGIAAFYEHLGVDAATDTVTLVISYYMNAETMGVYTLEEFVRGMTKLNANTLEELKKKLP